MPPSAPVADDQRYKLDKLDTPEKGQMSGIQELFEVGDVLIGIHVVIDICALLHDLSVFINEKSFYRDIEFLEMVRKIFLIGRKQAA